MGHSFEFDAANNIIRCTRTGQVTNDLMFEVYSEAQELLWARPSCNAIEDFSGVTRVDVSSEVVRRMADLPVFSSIETLVIVAPQDHIYGLSRMYSILSERRRNVHVVRTMEEAYSLLGVQSPQFCRIRKSTDASSTTA